jgi:hypothetical protein
MWCDMVWCGVMWCDDCDVVSVMMWCGVMWSWCDVKTATWCNVLRCDVMRWHDELDTMSDAVCFDAIQCDVAPRGVAHVRDVTLMGHKWADLIIAGIESAKLTCVNCLTSSFGLFSSKWTTWRNNNSRQFVRTNCTRFSGIGDRKVKIQISSFRCSFSSVWWPNKKNSFNKQLIAL